MLKWRKNGAIRRIAARADAKMPREAGKIGQTTDKCTEDERFVKLAAGLRKSAGMHMESARPPCYKEDVKNKIY